MRLIWLLHFVLFISAVAANRNTRLRSDPTAPLLKHADYGIEGGEYTSIGKHPYTVALLLNDTLVGGGTILNRRWILCSAFEISGNRYNYNLTIRVGSDKVGSGGQTVYTSKIIIHPKYKNGYKNDVALIKTTKRIKFSKKAKPINIARSAPKAGYNATVTGWGLQDYGGEPSKQLKAATVIVRSRVDCKANQTDLDTRQSFCADADGIGSCIGDSGDPLVYNNQLIGYYQGGDLCDIFQNLDVYANVAVYRRWIIKTIRKHSVEESTHSDDDKESNIDTED